MTHKTHTSSRNSQGELPAKNLRPALKLRTYNEEGRPSLISGMETVKLLGRYFFLSLFGIQF